MEVNKKIIDNLIELTVDNKLDWIYMGENDPFYDTEKEQFTSEYKITKNKKIDILLTKIYFNRYENYFVKFFYDSKNITNLYYQEYDKIFYLFAQSKFYSAFKDESYLKYFKQKLYSNWNEYKWVKYGKTYYKSILEKKDDYLIHILVTDRVINIYLDNKEIDPIVLTIIDDHILFKILYENINK